jgi:PAS domain S-box-containing protein
LIEASPAGLIVVTRGRPDAHGQPEMDEIVGYTQDDMKTVHTRDTYASPADRDAFVAALQREGKVQNYEGRFRRKDGSEFWGRLSSVCRFG